MIVKQIVNDRKVDSHIAIRVYAPGILPKGNKYYIYINEYADKLVGNIREEAEHQSIGYPNKEFLYSYMQVIVQSLTCQFFYGKMEEWVMNIIGNEITNISWGRTSNRLRA